MSKIATIDELNIFTEIKPILDKVLTTSVWIVVVCPNKEIALQYMQILAGSIPPDTQFSGRTGICKSGGKVTIVSLEDDLITGEYLVAYLGWGNKVTIDKTSVWLKPIFNFFCVENL